MKINFLPSNGGPERETKAYEGKPAKILARWPENTGKYVMKNSDSLALYALAHYVQGQIGGYPLYPLVNEEAIGAPHLLTTKEGKVSLNTDSPEAAAWPEAGVKWCDDDEDQPTENTVLKMDALAPDSAYPPEYLQSVSSAAPTASETPVQGKKDENKCHGVSGDIWVIHRDTAVKNAEEFCSQSTKSRE